MINRRKMIISAFSTTILLSNTLSIKGFTNTSELSESQIDIKEIAAFCTSDNTTKRNEYLQYLKNTEIDQEQLKEIINRIVFLLQEHKSQISQNTENRKQAIKRYGEYSAIKMDVLKSFCHIKTVEAKNYVLDNAVVDSPAMILSGSTTYIDGYPVSTCPIIHDILQSKQFEIQDIMNYVVFFQPEDVHKSQPPTLLYIMLEKLQTKGFGWDEGKKLLIQHINEKLENTKTTIPAYRVHTINEIIGLCKSEDVRKHNVFSMINKK